MLLFKNNEKDTYFVVNTESNTAHHVGDREFYALHKYKQYMTSWSILELKDYKAVKQFQKIIKSGIYNKENAINVKSRILNDYPELFI